MDLPLPNEMIVKILSYLPHGDLCSFSLVSHRMYNLASTPNLWSKVILSRPALRHKELAELMSYERYNLLEKIDLYQLQISEQKLVKIIEQTMDMPGLKTVVLYDHVLTNIPAELLAKAFTRLQEVVVGGTYLTRGQLKLILESSLASGSLKMLDLSNLSKISEDMWENTGHLPQGVRHDSVNQELGNVSEDLLTKSLMRLEKLSLKCNKLGLLQWNSLLENTPASNLKDLDLSFNSEIIDIPSITLAMAVASLRKVNLAYITLTDEQLLCIFKLIKTSQTLEELNIGNIKLQDIPNQDMETLCKLKMVNIEGTNLTNVQANSVLQAISNVDHPTYPNKIKSLNISRNSIQDTPSQLLANACLQLTHLNISDTYLTNSQCVAIFSALPNSNMTFLDISGVRISLVPADILSRGVCSLKEVDLSSTMTTTQQVIAILTRSKDSKTLHKVVGIAMRNIPEHLEECATYLSMVTPYGNLSLRARRQERLKKNGKAPRARPKVTLPPNSAQPQVSGMIPPPPPPPPSSVQNQFVPPPPPPPPPSY
eukprot:GFUD01030027.1.p1 GENE.GFUD01030027.1~~GFUD01030027.1.p1  ORF type:complete len:541 (-),score=122.28 GFUD01030027.1:35-1657(-)